MTCLKPSRPGRWLTISCGAAAVLSLSASPSRAQIFSQIYGGNITGLGIEPGVTVLSRLRPDYDYPGIPVGDFTIRPTVTESVGLDSNVLGTPQAKSSFLAETNATVSAFSNWARDSLRMDLSVDDFQYPDQPQQSYTNWTAALSGTIDIGRDVLSLSYSHQNLNETPRDLDTPQLNAPIPFQIDSFLASYRLNFSRLFVTPSIGVNLFNFSNGVVAGQPYLQTDQDRTVITPSVLVGYELSPRRNIIAILSNSTADYKSPEPSGPRFNYNDTSLLAGLDYDGGGLWRYRLLGGYEVRNFAASQFKQITGPIVELTAIFNPSGLTTFTGVVSRRIEDATNNTTTGLTETAGRLSVDHEYLRNVLLHGEADVYYDQYAQGGGTQTLYALGASATWLMNRHMRLTGSYTFTARDSPNNLTAAGTNASTTTGLNNTVGGPLGASYRDHVALLKISFGL